MNEIRVIECKRAAQERLEDVITAINKGDVEELKSFMVSGLMTEEEFNSFDSDGKLINDEGIFCYDGWYFQLSQDFCYSQTDPKYKTDRYVIWGFAENNDKDPEENILDIVYWTWGSPAIGDKIINSVLEQCKNWIKKSKEQGLKPFKEETWTK